MQIFNFRDGFANNSSSTHSTMLNLHGRKLEDILPEYFSYDRGKFNEAEFGWGEFVLTSKEDKDLYLAAQIWSNLSGFTQGIPAEAKIGFIEQVIPELRDRLKVNGEYGVDHQSVWALPKNCGELNPQFPSVEFIRDLRNYLHKPEVVILGGNDNEEDEINRNELVESVVEILPRDPGWHSGWTCRKDGDVWLLFDYKQGQKIRFSFKDNVKNESSEVPELVDLIITNHCKTNCNFCYRECIDGGDQADINKVRDMVHSLIRWKVPEIVIGGGDILLYNDFDKLCKCVKEWREEYNVAINTTINPIIKDGKIEGNFRKKLDLLAESFSSIALSGISYHTFSVYNYLNLTSRVSVSIQIIPELILNNDYNVKKLMSFIENNWRTRITLLGLKDTGRMLDYTTRNYNVEAIKKNTEKISDFVKRLEDSDCYLGMDTAFIQKFRNIAEKYDKRLWFDQEGKFSCCIDMAQPENIKPTMSKSSYDGQVHYIESWTEDLQEAWTEIKKE